MDYMESAPTCFIDSHVLFLLYYLYLYKCPRSYSLQPNPTHKNTPTVQANKKTEKEGEREIESKRDRKKERGRGRKQETGFVARDFHIL